MRLPDLMATGWTEIWAHKMRSFLSFFAIAIGIATFFYTLSVLSQRYRQLDRSAAISGVGRIDTSTQHSLTLAQYEDLKSHLPQGTSLSFSTQRIYFARINYKGNKIGGFETKGVMPTWQDSSFVYKLEGRFFNWKDIFNKHKVVVLTVFPHERKERRLWEWVDPIESEVKLRDFTLHHNLLNQSVSISQQTFTVIGLLHVPPQSEDVRFPQDKEETPMNTSSDSGIQTCGRQYEEIVGYGQEEGIVVISVGKIAERLYRLYGNVKVYCSIEKTIGMLFFIVFVVAIRNRKGITSIENTVRIEDKTNLC